MRPGTALCKPKSLCVQSFNRFLAKLHDRVYVSPAPAVVTCFLRIIHSPQQLSLHNRPSLNQLQPNPSLDCNAAAIEGTMKNIRKGKRLVRRLTSSMQSRQQLPMRNQQSSNQLEPNPSHGYGDAAIEYIMKRTRKGGRLAGPMTTYMQSPQQLPLHYQPSSSQLQPYPSLDCNDVAVEDIMKSSRKSRHPVISMTISMHSMQQLPSHNQPSSSQLQPNASVNCSAGVEDMTSQTRKGSRLADPTTISIQSSQQLPLHNQPSSSQLQPNQSLDCNDAAVEGKVDVLLALLPYLCSLRSNCLCTTSQTRAIFNLTNLLIVMMVLLKSSHQLPSHSQPSSSQLQPKQSFDCNDATVEGIMKHSSEGRCLASSMAISMQSQHQSPSHSRPITSEPSSSQLQPNISLDCNESSDDAVEESLKSDKGLVDPHDVLEYGPCLKESVFQFPSMT